jgi:hypothetical protein
MRALQQAEWRLSDRDNEHETTANTTHPPRPQKAVDLDLNLLRQEIMARFRRTLAYLAK